MATKITIKLSVVLFKQDNIFIAYCPALDLSGYGETETEAKKSFSIALNEFMDYTVKKKTLESELQKLGWKTKSKTSKKLYPPTFFDAISKNKELQKLVNTNDIKKYDKALPIYA